MAPVVAGGGSSDSSGVNTEASGGNTEVSGGDTEVSGEPNGNTTEGLSVPQDTPSTTCSESGLMQSIAQLVKTD